MYPSLTAHPWIVLAPEDRKDSATRCLIDGAVDVIKEQLPQELEVATARFGVTTASAAASPT